MANNSAIFTGCPVDSSHGLAVKTGALIRFPPIHQASPDDRCLYQTVDFAYLQGSGYGCLTRQPVGKLRVLIQKLPVMLGDFPTPDPPALVRRNGDGLAFSMVINE